MEAILRRNPVPIHPCVSRAVSVSKRQFRVYLLPEARHLEMEVRASGTPGVANGSKYLLLRYMFAYFDIKSPEVRISGLKTLRVLHDNCVTVTLFVTCINDFP